MWLLYTTLALPLFQYRRSTGRRLRRFTGPQPAEVAYRARKTLLHKCPQPPSPIPDQSNSYQICLVGSKCNCEAFLGAVHTKNYVCRVFNYAARYSLQLNRDNADNTSVTYMFEYSAAREYRNPC